jgi:hypothetical protein
MTILFELGVINPEPIHTGVGGGSRVWYRRGVGSFVDILGTLLLRIGGCGVPRWLETDQYGNLNRPSWGPASSSATLWAAGATTRFLRAQDRRHHAA